MRWLLVEGDQILASGSWQAVIEAGEEMGLIARRASETDGSETASIMRRRGLIMAPELMFPDASELHNDSHESLFV